MANLEVNMVFIAFRLSQPHGPLQSLQYATKNSSVCFIVDFRKWVNVLTFQTLVDCQKRPRQTMFAILISIL